VTVKKMKGSVEKEKSQGNAHVKNGKGRGTKILRAAGPITGITPNEKTAEPMPIWKGWLVSRPFPERGLMGTTICWGESIDLGGFSAGDSLER